MVAWGHWENASVKLTISDEIWGLRLYVQFFQPTRTIRMLGIRSSSISLEKYSVAKEWSCATRDRGCF